MIEIRPFPVSPIGITALYVFVKSTTAGKPWVWPNALLYLGQERVDRTTVRYLFERVEGIRFIVEDADEPSG